MGYVLDPRRRLRREVRRVAVERLDHAIDLLDRALDPADDIDLETAVHEVRKRCKSSRGLARLVRPALGDDFTTFDRLVRDAANELSSLRDAHALLRTFDALAGPEGDPVVMAVRDRHARIARTAEHAAISSGDARLSTARSLLAEARRAARRWRVPDGFAGLDDGILATYRRGRRGLRRASADPTDERLHEWRKAVKYLWYQMQLVHDAAPSVLGPLVDELDRLAETLGDDHDLAVLVHLLSQHPAEYGSPDELDQVCALARRRQHELRARAFRSGATIYAESAPTFVRRIGSYWQLTVTLGPEPQDEPDDTERPDEHVERERKFLVHDLPEGAELADAVVLRQGYLAADPRRSVRIRDAGSEGCTLTVKAGAGAERTEIEWTIDRAEFDAAWPHTEGQRIEKTRRRIPHGRHLIELDVFGGALDGLVIAEVEFPSADALAEFTPPDWFGIEVTDDGRYSNASLALHGLPT
jgi:CYTH domain-containing protein/CHAD domain-containing protein